MRILDLVDHPGLRDRRPGVYQYPFLRLPASIGVTVGGLIVSVVVVALVEPERDLAFRARWSWCRHSI